MSRPLLATIHLQALAHNLEQVRRFAPQSKVWAVIKANAYGHGLLRAADGLAEADGFAILNIEDALKLRESGWHKPILLLEGVFSSEEYLLCAEHRLTPVVHSFHQCDWLAASALPVKLPVYLKLNTGMNRLGFPLAEFERALGRLRAMPQVEVITLMTHFAEADAPNGTERPLSLLKEIAAGHAYQSSLANSAAVVSAPQTHGDWVRPGIMLYGATPFADRSAASLGLRPAMALTSEVIAIQHLQAGSAVGYGSSFVAEKPMRIGVIACGYADGYPRHAPSGTPIVVAGRRTRLVGRVSMDMITADITDIPSAQIGSPVELWGARLPVDEVASVAGTVGYELLSALAPRVAIQCA